MGITGPIDPEKEGEAKVYQQCIIVGNLGKDPEMRYMADGTPVTSFTVAVNKKWTGGEKTWWFKVTCWRKLAEVTNEYLKKGRQVMVVGEIEASAFIGQDGQARASLDLTAREVKFLGGAGSFDGGGGGSAGASYGDQSSGAFAQNEEDIPF
jgi:single-strand DNA-binding protein